MHVDVLLNSQRRQKMIANLCSSAVQAMKVEIESLKNGATDSGNNPAGSQNSDLVAGNNPPPSKRRKTVSEATNSSEDEARDEEEPPVDLRLTGRNGDQQSWSKCLRRPQPLLKPDV